MVNGEENTDLEYSQKRTYILQPFDEAIRESYILDVVSLEKK